MNLFHPFFVISLSCFLFSLFSLNSLSVVDARPPQGNILTLPATHSFFSANASAAIPSGPSSSRTLSAWIYRPSNAPVTGPFETVIAFSSLPFRCDSSELAFGVETETNKIFITACGQSTVYSTTPVLKDKWYHIAATISQPSNIITVYVNAIAGNPLSIPSLSTSNQRICVGVRCEGSHAFSGFIDELHIYDRALAAWEIGNDMNNPPAFKALPGLIVRFDGGVNENRTVIDTIRGITLPGLIVASSTSSNPPPSPQGGSYIVIPKKSGYVSVDSTYTMPSESNARTISVWVKQTVRPPTSGTAFLSFSADSINCNNQEFSMGIDEKGRAAVTSCSTFLATHPMILALDQWYHIAFTYNETNTNNYLYVNGVQGPLINIPQSLNTIVTDTFFGLRGFRRSGYFIGYLDNLHTYNRVLSPDDILNDKNNPAWSVFGMMNSFPMNRGSDRKLLFDTVGNTTLTATLMDGATVLSIDCDAQCINESNNNNPRNDLDTRLTVPVSTSHFSAQPDIFFPSGSSTRTYTVWFQYHGPPNQNFLLLSFLSTTKACDGSDLSFHMAHTGQLRLIHMCDLISESENRDMDFKFDQQWHHAAVTISPTDDIGYSKVIFYFDGVAGNGEDVYLFADPPNPLLLFTVGTRGLGDNEKFIGLMDEVHVYNRELTSLEIILDKHYLLHEFFLKSGLVIRFDGGVNNKKEVIDRMKGITISGLLTGSSSPSPAGGDYLVIPASGYLQFDNPLIIPPSFQAGTFSVWIKQTARLIIFPSVIFLMRHPVYPYRSSILLGIDKNGHAFFQYGDHLEPNLGYRAIHPTIIHLNQWYHIAVTYDAYNNTNGYLYVDGVPSDQSIPSSHTIRLKENTELVIGSNHVEEMDFGFFGGDINHFHIYHGLLTEDQIKIDRNTTQGPPMPHHLRRFDLSMTIPYNHTQPIAGKLIENGWGNTATMRNGAYLTTANLF